MSEGWAAGAIAGGLGLVLSGLRVSGDGAVEASAGFLRARTRGWSTDRVRALTLGLLTGLVAPGSGRAVRGAIGFGNLAGVRLWSALWIVLGTSLATVAFVWGAAGVAVGAPAGAIGLAAVALGTLLRLAARGDARGAWGDVLVGLGLVMLGVQILGDGLGALGDGTRFDGVSLPFPVRMAVGLLAAGGMTALLGASSPVLAFVLLAAGSGALQLSTGVAMLVGAHVGAAAPSAWLLRSGTPNARRLALGHVGLHAITGAIGVLSLGLAAPAIGSLPAPFDRPPLALATFLTLLVGLGAAAAWVAAGHLVPFLESRFTGLDGDGFRAQHLDAASAALPPLATECLADEVRRVGEVARRLAHTVLTGERLTQFRLERDLATTAGLEASVDEEARRLESAVLTAGTAGEVGGLRRAARAFAEIAERAASIRTRQLDQDGQVDPQLRARLVQAQHGVAHLLTSANPLGAEFHADVAGEYDAVGAHVVDLRSRVLAACAHGALSLPSAETVLARLEELDHLARLAIEACAELGTGFADNAPPAAEAPPEPSEEELAEGLGPPPAQGVAMGEPTPSGVHPLSPIGTPGSW